MEPNPSSSKVNRKTIEKNRRDYMKSLFCKLSSLVPRHSREVLSQPDQLEEATNYIKKLQTNLEKLKERRDSIVAGSSASGSHGTEAPPTSSLKLPQIEIHQTGSALEVVLITGLDSQFKFSETLRVLHQEGAEVLNASFSVIDNNILQTIHSKIGESEPHCGVARISERLKKIVNVDK